MNPLFKRILAAAALGLMLLVAGCDSQGDDDGTCVIFMSGGGDSTTQDISLDECQNRYHDTAGASG